MFPLPHAPSPLPSSRPSPTEEGLSLSSSGTSWSGPTCRIGARAAVEGAGRRVGLPCGRRSAGWAQCPLLGSIHPDGHLFLSCAKVQPGLPLHQLSLPLLWWPGSAGMIFESLSGRPPPPSGTPACLFLAGHTFTFLGKDSMDFSENKGLFLMCTGEANV